MGKDRICESSVGPTPRAQVTQVNADDGHWWSCVDAPTRIISPDLDVPSAYRQGNSGVCGDAVQIVDAWGGRMRHP